MTMGSARRMVVAATMFGVCGSLTLFPGAVSSSENESAKLIAAVMGASPMAENLRRLTDEIGGRGSGTAANKQAVGWGIESFRAAGVDEVHTEKFTLPVSWSEGQTRLEILGTHAFPVHVV